LISASKGLWSAEFRESGSCRRKSEKRSYGLVE
jgi:hypothetical protein